MSKLYIVTVATKSDLYFPFLRDSCKKNGKNLVVLGDKQKWQGFTWRFKLVLEYMKKLKDNDIVCCVDGYDVICSRNLNKLQSEFIEFMKKNKEYKIIIGADQFADDFLKVSTGVHFGVCDGKNLNMGTYIGYVKDLREVIGMIYKLADYKNNKDDQILAIKYCNYNKDIFFIDTEAKFFLTYVNPLNEIDDRVIVKNGEELIYGKSKPFFVHGPGSTYLDNIIEKLGYKNTKMKQIHSKLKKDYYNRAIKNFTKNYILWSVIIGILLILIFYYFMKIIKK